MKLYGISLKEIDFDFIAQTLVGKGIPENQILEYKPGGFLADVPGKPTVLENNKRELLKKICGFANASGGFLIYGVKEKDHQPIDIGGTDVLFEDIVIGQIHRGLSPSCDYEIKKVDNPKDTLKPLFILEIIESPVPVMVYLKDEIGQFYIRRNELSELATRLEVDMLFAKSENNRILALSAQRIYDLLARYVEYLPRHSASAMATLKNLLWLKQDCVELGIIPIVDKLSGPVFVCVNEKYQIADDGISILRSEPPITSVRDPEIGLRLLEDFKVHLKREYSIFIV